MVEMFIFAMFIVLAIICLVAGIGLGVYAIKEKQYVIAGIALLFGPFLAGLFATGAIKFVFHFL